jgi:hypothetical protein
MNKNKPQRDAIDNEIKRFAVEIEREQNKGKNLDTFEKAIKHFAHWNPYDQNEYSRFFDSVWVFGIDKGFDIVIGNPPYIQLQDNHGELADLYSNTGYECFVRYGDIYQLFYERGYKLLKENGHFLTAKSNSFIIPAFLAEYAQPLTAPSESLGRIFGGEYNPNGRLTAVANPRNGFAFMPRADPVPEAVPCTRATTIPGIEP